MMYTIKGTQRTLSILLTLLLMLFSMPTLASEKTAVVKAKTVKMYEAPKESASVLGELSRGTEVTVLAVSGRIAKIKYVGKIGYVRKSALKLTSGGDKAGDKKKSTPAPAPAASVRPAPETKAVAAKTAQGPIRKTARRAVAYLEPSLSCKKRTAVPRNTAMMILGETGDFYKVRRGNVVAYMLKAAFEAAPAKTPAPIETASKIVTNESKLYKKASRASKVLRVLKPGESVGIIRQGKDYAKVSIDGITGFVTNGAFKGELRTPTPAPTEASATPRPTATPRPAGDVNSAKAETVIAAALAQLGKPYVYGRTGPSSFDCSGLTYYAYRQVSVSLPHSAQSVGYGAGEKVTRGALQRGDLVCFNTISDNDLCDHVGIYLGGGQFVHASSGQGRVVVSTLSGYYETAFSWGRRVL